MSTKDPLKIKAKNARSYAKNKAQQLEHKKTVRSRDPAAHRARKRFYVTGHSPELVAFLRELQENKCAICEREMVRGRYTDLAECADHCHESNRPRGLLCGRCNKSLGFYEKSRDLHLAFESYLASPPAGKFGKVVSP